ncbi:MAG: 4-hydroxy-tetrahydrodipicolinate reductase [bacterium]
MAAGKLKKVCVFGDGAMGRSLQAAARSAGLQVSAVFTGDDIRSGRPRKKGDLKGADVGIDFSGSGAVLQNVRRAVGLGLPMVEGTTGWSSHLPDVEAAVLNGEGALLYAPNFSFGMNVLVHIVEQAADLFETAPEYDPFVLEHHHRGKADSPSGTALRLSEILLERMSGKNLVQTSTGGEIAPNQLSLASVRAGSEPGRHEVGFDGPYESIRFRHAARERAVFGHGALRAADWLLGREGVYTMRDVMGDLLEEARLARVSKEREEQHEG